MEKFELSIRGVHYSHGSFYFCTVPCPTHKIKHQNAAGKCSLKSAETHLQNVSTLFKDEASLVALDYINSASNYQLNPR